MERIEQLEEAAMSVLKEDFNDILPLLLRLSGGNPGAIACIKELLDKYPMWLMKLDELGIRGSEIYILWNDRCGRDIEKFVDLLMNKSDEELRELAKG